jgi:hypothetical protein
MIEVVDTSKLAGYRYPEKLFGSWMHFVFFEDHHALDGICSVYFNDKYPSGSICTSSKMLNDYPDIYATWQKPGLDNTIVADRMLVIPRLRQSGIGKAAISQGALILNKIFGKRLIHKRGSEIGNLLWKSAFGETDVENSEPDLNIDLQDDFFIQPAYPFVYFGKREA